MSEKDLKWPTITYVFSETKALLPLKEKMLQAIEKEFNTLQTLDADDTILNVKIETNRKTNDSWGKDVKVFFYYPPDASNLPQVVAIEREN